MPVSKRPAAATPETRGGKRTRIDPIDLQIPQTFIGRYMGRCWAKLAAERRTNIKEMFENTFTFSTACSGSGIPEAVHATMHKLMGKDATGSNCSLGLSFTCVFRWPEF